MFYTPDNKPDELPHNPFKAIVAPRPIGWISSLSSKGKFNLAPYSFFNAVSDKPPMVMFSSVGWKDSASNIRDTGEFVCNYVGANVEVAMNQTSVDAPPDVNEAVYAGLELEASQLVKPPRVKDVWAALECKLTQIIEIADSRGNTTDNVMVLGEVIGFYICDEAIVNGEFEVDKTKPVSRGGYLDFGRSGEKFQMPRPVWGEK